MTVTINKLKKLKETEHQIMNEALETVKIQTKLKV